MDERIKGSILEQEPPPTNDFVNRVRFCAKALAYGAAHDLWEPRIRVSSDSWSQLGNDDYAKRFNYYFNANLPDDTNVSLDKTYTWNGLYPRISFLETFDYVIHTESIRPDRTTKIGAMPIWASNYDIYLLTHKAFQLLETPLTPPKVFISYRREVSTVLGLLIEARLKALSSDLNPFIDKELTVGEPWEDQLKQKVKACDTFISLIGSKNSFSDNVMNEIRWAMQANKKIISIWHGEFTTIEPSLCPDSELAEFLGDNHGIAVKGSQAIDYEMAITLLENELHYF